MDAQLNKTPDTAPSGILLIDKPSNMSSFAIVAILRKLLNVQKIGHAGTLDPFATGVMVMLIGKQYTKLSDQFLTSDKEYVTTVLLGVETDSYDSDGVVVKTSTHVPTLEDIQLALTAFQGEIMQTPPMFSAKKQKGKRLYELARQGITVDRPACKVTLSIELLSYDYPHLKLRVTCSKGTYIRSIAYDLGKALGCGGHLIALQRTRSGSFHIKDCVDGALLKQPFSEITLSNILAKLIKIETVI